MEKLEALAAFSGSVSGFQEERDELGAAGSVQSTAGRSKEELGTPVP